MQENKKQAKRKGEIRNVDCHIQKVRKQVKGVCKLIELTMWKQRAMAKTVASAIKISLQATPDGMRNLMSTASKKLPTFQQN